MKNLKTNLMAIIIAIVTTVSCNKARDENRVVKKGKTDSLLIISIPDASCGKCQKVIEDGLSNQKGVKQSILSLKTKKVSVVYDSKVTSPEIITSTITQLQPDMPCYSDKAHVQ